MLNKTDVLPAVKEFYRFHLMRLAREVSLSEAHTEPKRKFLNALIELERTPVTTDERTLKIVNWLSEKQLAAFESSKTFDELIEDTSSSLRRICNGADVAEVVYYLVFFREVTARFLRKEFVQHSLEKNDAAYDLVFGGQTAQVFDHYVKHSSLLSIYSASFADAYQSAPDRAVLASLNLRGKRILDAGGGSGGLGYSLFQIGVAPEVYDLLDLPETAAALVGSRRHFFDKVGFDHNFVAGNFFKDSLDSSDYFRAHEASYDVIVLTWILHDWNDSQNLFLLNQLRPLLKSEGKLIVVERPKDSEQHPFSATYEFVMLLLANGIERTLSEYQLLCSDAGFKFEEHRSIAGSRDFMVFTK